jgi:hypothetical protein
MLQGCLWHTEKQHHAPRPYRGKIYYDGTTGRYYCEVCGARMRGGEALTTQVWYEDHLLTTNPDKYSEWYMQLFALIHGVRYEGDIEL